MSLEFQEYTSNLSKSFRRNIGFIPNPVHPDEVKKFNK